ncbi:MAG: hypothetical protein OEM05_04505 [Myxococcales bacterium]|nr:hypothetical protein [Myxococcales bacterium]
MPLFRRNREFDRSRIVAEAARHLPGEVRAWEAIAQILKQRGRGRAAQFRIEPGVGPAWRWLRAALQSDREALRKPSEVVYLRSGSARR